jgi:nucleoid-associated protein YgaU
MFDSVLDSERLFGHHLLMDRTYVRRRRIAAGALLSLTLAIGLPAAANALGGRPAPVRPMAERQYVVRDGDTLWTIATHLDGAHDPREVVDAIAAANGLGGADIVPGQVLVVPTA